MKPSLGTKGETNFVLPRREMCSLLIRAGPPENQQRWLCSVVQSHVARMVFNDGHAIGSKSEPSSPFRKPKGTRPCSSAATSALSLGALEAPRRRLFR
jgi:hypothetical protein